LLMSPVKTQSPIGLSLAMVVLFKVTANLALVWSIASGASGSLISGVAVIGTTTPIIQVTAVSAQEGFSGETYLLTGTTTGTAMIDKTVDDWVESGTGCDAGWC